MNLFHLKRIVNTDPHNINFWRRWQTSIRRKRFRFIHRLISSVEKPFLLLDIGGTQEFWEQISYPILNIQIVLYNLDQILVTHPSMHYIQGDACAMEQFSDQQFAFILSNSVIEHVGSYKRQQSMAREVQRIGQRYCIQTPNRYFPIEPHVLLPCFQFLPFWLQVWLLSHFRSPWGWKIDNRQAAETYIREIRLLTEKELRQLFPHAFIYKEKFLGLTKSFIVYN